MGFNPRGDLGHEVGVSNPVRIIIPFDVKRTVWRKTDIPHPIHFSIRAHVDQNGAFIVVQESPRFGGRQCAQIGQFSLLGAMLVAALFLAPWAAAVALRIAVE